MPTRTASARPPANVERLEVQHLAVPTDVALPGRVAIDIGAIAQDFFNRSPSGDLDVVLPPLVDAIQRSSRDALWIVAPPITSVRIDDIELRWLELSLKKLVGNEGVLVSKQPLPGLLAACSDERVGLVSAGVEVHRHLLWPLVSAVAAILDVSTGRVWQSADATAELVAPIAAPVVAALTETPFGGDPLVKDAIKYRDTIGREFAAGTPLDQIELPSRRARQRIGQRLQAIYRLALTLVGADPLDPGAQKRLSTWLRKGKKQYFFAQPTSTGTTYLTAEVRREGPSLVVDHVFTQDGGDITEARGHQEAIKHLRTLPRNRWFGPHLMDLLGAAHDAGLDLPETAVDPALMLYMLDPDDPPALGDHVFEGDALEPRARSWLESMDRDKQPPERLVEVARLLPTLDERVGTALKTAELNVPLEIDVATTVPVLAKIERKGAWVGDPFGRTSDPEQIAASWQQVLAERNNHIDQQIALLRPVLGHLDPLRATTAEVVLALWERVASLVGSERPLELTAKQKLKRLAAAGVEEAVALVDLRALTSSSAGPYWLQLISAGERRLMGRFSPQTTGRWGYAKHPLQNLPKHGTDGRRIRAGLYGPPGYKIVAADWDSFESRLLASVTGDPVLLAAAWDPSENMHAVMAATLSTSRSESKAATHAIAYGQSKDGFWKSHPEFPRAKACNLYDRIWWLARGATAYQENFKRTFVAGRSVRSPAGWRRKPTKWREGFNMLIQGMAADIMRWVLCALDVELAAFGAFLIHQTHDEVFVATPSEKVIAVVATLREAMNRGVRECSGLLAVDVPLPVKVRQGRSWLDVS